MLSAFYEARPKYSESARESYFAYIEASTFTKLDGSQGHRYTVKYLAPTDLEDWAWRKNKFAAPSSSVQDGSLESELRVLFAQPRSSFRANIPEQLVTANVLAALHLPLCTFASFRMAPGTYSAHTEPAGSAFEHCQRLGLVFRSPQKWEFTVGGLAVSHDFATRTTTALNVGFAFGLDKYKADDRRAPESLWALLQQMRKSQELLSHPFSLPSLVLARHILRVSAYIKDHIAERVVQLESAIGVTKAGRSFMRGGTEVPNLFVDEQMHRNNAKRLTADINDLTTWIMFTRRSPEWDIECIDFLLGLLNKSRKLRECHGIAVQPFYEALYYMRNYAQGCLESCQTSKARMDLQLNILYTSVAQDDGQTSARLAAAAGRDSTSMKIIALITAAYLPGTFIATLFSMGMFDWNAGSTGSVSSSFWIYWVVSIPLTIITLLGWGLWWQFEKKRFTRDVQEVSQQPSRHRDLGEALEELKAHGLGLSARPKYPACTLFDPVTPVLSSQHLFNIGLPSTNMSVTMSSSPYLEGCPNEIIESIALALDLPDIANLRCTSRSMKEKATQDRFKSFFRTKRVRLNERCLKAFVQNTGPGMLGCLVEELDLIGLVYNHVQLEKILRTKTRTVVKRNGPMTMSTEEHCGPAELEKVQADLDTLKMEQDSAEKLHRSGVDVELLAQAFANIKGNGRGSLKKLRTLVTVYRDDAVTEIKPLQGGSYKLIWRKAAETLRSTLAALTKATLAVEELDAYSELPRCAVAANELSTMKRDDDSILGSMTSFSISVSGRDIAKTDHQATELEQPAFPSLRFQQTHTPRDPNILKAEAEDESNFMGLASLLALMPKLETMDLHFYDLHSAIETHRPRLFSRIVEHTVFANLTGLRLRGFHIREEDLLTFVKRSPLRMMRFENLYMIEGTWRALLDFIAGGPQLYEWILVDDLFERYDLLYFSGEGDGQPKFPTLCGTTGTNGFLRRGEDTKRAIVYHFATQRPLGSPQAYNWRVVRQLEYGPPDGL